MLTRTGWTIDRRTVRIALGSARAARLSQHLRDRAFSLRGTFVKHTVIAVFDHAAQARQASDDLRGRFGQAAVHVSEGSEAFDTAPLPAAVAFEGGPASGLLHRLALLLNVEEPHVAHYEEAMRRGGTVVTVDAADQAQATTARDALLAAGAVNIDDRVEQWQQTGWNAAGAGVQTNPPGGTAGVVMHRQEVSIDGVRVYGVSSVRAFDAFADEFRADHATRYAAGGAGYDEFEPAYRYGHALASDARSSGRDWVDIENDARADWEQQRPESAWERYQSAIRHAWERVVR